MKDFWMVVMFVGLENEFISQGEKYINKNEHKFFK